VYGCSDGTTLVVAAEKANPAAPFYFIFHRKGNGYELYGEGAGRKEFTKAAFEELRTLNERDISSLIAATRAK